MTEAQRRVAKAFVIDQVVICPYSSPVDEIRFSKSCILITLASKHLSFSCASYFIGHRFTKDCVLPILLSSTVGRETSTARPINIQSFSCRKLQSIF